jgi:hypothetical protein
MGEGGGRALPGKAPGGTYQGVCGNLDQCFPSVAIANAGSVLGVPILAPANKEAELSVVLVLWVAITIVAGPFCGTKVWINHEKDGEQTADEGRRVSYLTVSNMSSAAAALWYQRSIHNNSVSLQPVMPA